MDKNKKSKDSNDLSNTIVIKQKPYYYDRDATDADAQKDFSDMLADLKKINLKLRNELNREKEVKLDIKKDSNKEK